MGVLDSYPHPYPLLAPEICEDIERTAVSWRWRLRTGTHRLSRTHGDFHPWNLLFRAGTDFPVLDRSRGEWGEPADDVSALGVNYLFYGLRSHTVEPFRFLFGTFLETYLRESRDQEVLEVLPPFLAFRALVIAHPVWYPELSDPVRRALIHFARRMMFDSRFDPSDVQRLLETPRRARRSGSRARPRAASPSSPATQPRRSTLRAGRPSSWSSTRSERS